MNIKISSILFYKLVSNYFLNPDIEVKFANVQHDLFRVTDNWRSLSSFIYLFI